MLTAEVLDDEAPDIIFHGDICLSESDFRESKNYL